MLIVIIVAACMGYPARQDKTARSTAHIKSSVEEYDTSTGPRFHQKNPFGRGDGVRVPDDVDATADDAKRWESPRATRRAATTEPLTVDEFIGRGRIGAEVLRRIGDVLGVKSEPRRLSTLPELLPHGTLPRGVLTLPTGLTDGESIVRTLLR